MRQMQRLDEFRLPDGFRGRPGWYVQLWRLVQATLFRCSPQVSYGWRRWLLRRFGARIGVGVIIRPSVQITYPWKLTIGDHAWVGDDVALYRYAGAIGTVFILAVRSQREAGYARL